MRERKAALGDKNSIGTIVTRLRKERHMTQKELMAMMQTKGVDISYSGLSKLEGQTRSATDKEILAIAKCFDISVSTLFPKEK